MTEQDTSTETEPTEPETAEPHDTEQEVDDETKPETFPRDYVERLRKESAKYRERAKAADDLAARLHIALVTATGRLADPTDLPFDEAHLDDEDALRSAVDDLIARKPHLASRKPHGDVGQGVGSPVNTVNLAGILRAGAA